MESPSRAGCLAGVLIIIQMFGSGMVNFVREGSLYGSPEFLVNAFQFATVGSGCTPRVDYRSIVGWHCNHRIPHPVSTHPKDNSFGLRCYSMNANCSIG